MARKRSRDGERRGVWSVGQRNSPALRTLSSIRVRRIVSLNKERIELQGTLKTRYFLAYLAYMRVGAFFPFFRVLSFLYVTITAHEVDHAHRRGIAPAPSQGRGFSSPYKSKLQAQITSSKEKPQGTLKTRYFLAYLVRMRV